MIGRWCIVLLALAPLPACSRRAEPTSATVGSPMPSPGPPTDSSPPVDAMPPADTARPVDAAPSPLPSPLPSPVEPGKIARPGPVATSHRRRVIHRAPSVTAAPSPMPVAATIYCPVLDRAAPAAECAQASAPDAHSADARAALSRPRSMYRGQTARVRFVVVQGADQSAADSGARTGAPTDTVDRVGTVRFTRRMEARLTGQGFRIDPPGLVRVDTGATGEAAWEWRITPQRSSDYYLQVEAWTLRREGDRWIRDRPLRYPSYAVAVPVRWWPDRIEDATHDSIAWFGEGTAWLKALAALLAAAAAAWAAWRKLRPARSTDHTR